MDAILYLFFAVLVIANAKLISQLGLSITYNLKRRKQALTAFSRISIVVPAFNEAKTIASCIESLLNLDYPNYEVIVVDDGSTDGTLQVASRIHDPRLSILHQSNSGKPLALNNGIKHSTGSIILTVDADTVLDSQSLKKLATHFEGNHSVGAVAGNVKVKKESTLLNCLQSAEYSSGINLIRKGQSVLGCVMIVPGPVAALSREAIEKVGYFSQETFAEDFDLTLSVLKSGYRIEYEEDSVAYTDAPKNVEDVIKQRRRWYRGMTQVLEKHKDMYLNPKFGISGLLGVPNLWLETITPLFNLGMLLIVLLTWFLASENYLTLTALLITLAFFLVTNFVTLRLEPKQEKRNYFIMPLLLFYNTFLDGIRIMSLTEEVVNNMTEWDKPQR